MWLTYGGSYDETRHSSLASVNGDTIQDLGVSWVYTMDKPRGAEATPIVVDGVMYVSGSWSVVYAIDAKTGEELWTYDPNVSGKDAAKGCCDVVNRGVAVHNGKVLSGVSMADLRPSMLQQARFFGVTSPSTKPSRTRLPVHLGSSKTK